MTISCSQGHPNPDASAGLTCSVCGEQLPVGPAWDDAETAPDAAAAYRRAAIISVVVGVVGFVLCGILLGPLAIWQGYRARLAAPPGTSTVLATTGMVIGAVDVVLAVVGATILLTN